MNGSQHQSTTTEQEDRTMNAKEQYEQWINENNRNDEFEVVYFNTEDETLCETTTAIIHDKEQDGYFMYNYNSETEEGEEVWIEKSMIEFFKNRL